MKKPILLFHLFLLSFVSYSQDTIKKNTDYPKFQISVQAGGFYKNFFDNGYIEPSTYEPGDSFEDHQYERFTKIPTGGFKTGLLINLKFAKQWYFSSGLLFCYRKDVFENNIDSVTKYHSSLVRNIHSTVKYDYTYNNFELPVMVLFKWKRLNFYAGAYVPVLCFKKAAYTYVINKYPQNPPWITSEKTIKSTEIPLKIYPALQISYAFKIKKSSIEPYLGIDFAEKKSFYIQGGIIYSVYNYLKK